MPWNGNENLSSTSWITDSDTARKAIQEFTWAPSELNFGFFIPRQVDSTIPISKPLLLALSVEPGIWNKMMLPGLGQNNREQSSLQRYLAQAFPQLFSTKTYNIFSKTIKNNYIKAFHGDGCPQIIVSLLRHFSVSGTDEGSARSACACRTNSFHLSRRPVRDLYWTSSFSFSSWASFRSLYLSLWSLVQVQSTEITLQKQRSQECRRLTMLPRCWYQLRPFDAFRNDRALAMKPVSQPPRPLLSRTTSLNTLFHKSPSISMSWLSVQGILKVLALAFETDASVDSLERLGVPCSFRNGSEASSALNKSTRKPSGSAPSNSWRSLASTSSGSGEISGTGFPSSRATSAAWASAITFASSWMPTTKSRQFTSASPISAGSSSSANSNSFSKGLSSWTTTKTWAASHLDILLTTETHKTN